MSRPLRVGVIGTGWWGTRAHLPALAAHPDAAIAAIAEPDEGNRRRAAERFAVAHAYATADEMLAAEELDAAIIAVPHRYHAPIARACLRRGLHVLLEKPMTIDPADAFELVDLARASGRELIVGYPWHFNRQALALRALLGEGRIGSLEAVTCLFASIVREFYHGRMEPYREVFGYPVNAPGTTTYSDPAISGGGQGQAQVTHSAALLLFLTGLHVAEISAFTADFELAVDLVDAAAVRFDGGALGSLASTGSMMLGQDEILEYRIFGTEGHVRFDVNGGTVTIHGPNGAIETLSPLPPEERYPESATARNLVEVAMGREANGSPGELGARVVAFVDAMYRSAREGRPVRPFTPAAGPDPDRDPGPDPGPASQPTGARA